MSLSALIADLSYAWLGIGCLTALVFLTYGIDRVVEDARDVYLFRVLIAPGVILLWPIVLWRWRQKEQGGLDWRYHHSPRRKLAGFLQLLLALSLLVILYVAVIIGPDPQTFPEPVKLGAFWQQPGDAG